MNYTNLVGIAVSSHADIDFVDVRVDADTALYIDPERIALSQHPFAIMADEVINDFFAVLCRAAAAHNEVDMYHLLSYGREPNETHLGLSSSHSCGRGTTPEILMPIIKSMISMRLFENKLITQLVDLQLWTPNFHYDRLSDLVTNIIRSVLVDYTYAQYDAWHIPLPEAQHHVAHTRDAHTHSWVTYDFPHFLAGQFHTLLVPKVFVGQKMLSSPGKLLYTYALRYRQQEHLDERTDYCHHVVKSNGAEIWKPPTKHELYDLEVRGSGTKAYLKKMGYEYPRMVQELHADHRSPTTRKSVFISDAELDSILYKQEDLAV